MLTIHDHTPHEVIKDIHDTYQQLTECAIIPVTPSTGQMFFRPYHAVSVPARDKEDWFWQSMHCAMENLFNWSNYRQVANVLDITQYVVHVYVPFDFDLSDIGEPSEHYNVNWIFHRHTYAELGNRIVLCPAGLTSGTFAPDKPLTIMQYHIAYR